MTIDTYTDLRNSQNNLPRFESDERASDLLDGLLADTAADARAEDARLAELRAERKTEQEAARRREQERRLERVEAERRLEAARRASARARREDIGGARAVEVAVAEPEAGELQRLELRLAEAERLRLEAERRAIEARRQRNAVAPGAPVAAMADSSARSRGQVFAVAMLGLAMTLASVIGFVGYQASVAPSGVQGTYAVTTVAPRVIHHSPSVMGEFVPMTDVEAEAEVEAPVVVAKASKCRGSRCRRPARPARPAADSSAGTAGAGKFKGITFSLDKDAAFNGKVQ